MRRRNAIMGTWARRDAIVGKGSMDDESTDALPWEYAIMVWDGDGRDDYRIVRFSHRKAWSPIGNNEYMATVRELGDEGFELVTHQFLVRGQYDRGGRYGESTRELLTFKRPLDE
jgi:hypothetical protein